jgi:hypothetical protein
MCTHRIPGGLGKSWTGERERRRRDNVFLLNFLSDCGLKHIFQKLQLGYLILEGNFFW